MIVTQRATIIFRDKKHECVVLLDPEIFHLAFMSKNRFEELFGRNWEMGATTKVLLGVKHEVNIDSYAVVDVKIRERTLKNIYVWLIDRDVNSILPPQYQSFIEEPVDLVLGSTILENFGIKLVRDEKSGSVNVIL